MGSRRSVRRGFPDHPALHSLVLGFLFGCEMVPDQTEAADSAGYSSAIALVWRPADAEDTWESARAGVDWALSQLGAIPPKDGSAITVQGEAPDRVALLVHLDRLSLSSIAATVLADVAAELNTETRPAEIGRFLLRSLHEPWRYYAMTGACGTRAEWETERDRTDAEYAVTTSLLTEAERRIQLNEAPASWADVSFLAEEGTGSLLDGSFQPSEAETLDVMPNGQFRFAVYDAAGGLVPAGVLSPAGTPGKCAWCHELTVQAGSAENTSAPGYLDYTAWMAARDRNHSQIALLRAELSTSVDYETLSVHEAGERLVEGFLLPDAARVAAEWGVSEAEVVAALGTGTEAQEEFGWTERYLRAEVDAASPFPVTATLQSARELDPDALLADAVLTPCE